MKLSGEYVIRCYGITKDPETNNFMMVMEYAEDGSLRQSLNKNFNSMDWKDKFEILYNISNGLKDIHKKRLIHICSFVGITKCGWLTFIDFSRLTYSVCNSRICA